MKRMIPLTQSSMGDFALVYAVLDTIVHGTPGARFRIFTNEERATLARAGIFLMTKGELKRNGIEKTKRMRAIGKVLGQQRRGVPFRDHLWAYPVFCPDGNTAAPPNLPSESKPLPTLDVPKHVNWDY